MVLEPAIVSLERVEQNSEHAIRLRMCNNSDHDLTLREIHVTCGCIKPDSLSDQIIPPGGDIPINIRYKPGLARGKTIQRVIAELAFPDHPERIFSRQCLIRADIIGEINAVPSNVREKIVHYTDHQYKIALQSNNGNEYTIDDILCTSSLLSASADRSVIGTSTETVLTVSADGRNPLVSNISGKVVLQLKGGVIDKLSVPIELSRENIAEIFPDSVFLSEENQYFDELTIFTSRPSDIGVVDASTSLEVQIESGSNNCVHTVSVKASVSDDSNKQVALKFSLEELSNKGDAGVIAVPIYISR